MAGDAARVADMRGGADRVFALALLASILLHALLLGVLPSGRAPAEQPAPLPLTARLAEEPAPPAPEPVAEVRKPAPPAAPAPVRRAAPKPAPAPVPVPQPVQLPIVAPAAPVAPAAAGPLARVEPLPAPSAAAPDADARELFRANLNAAATRFKRYPRSAIDNNWEGEVVVLMSIGADGRIASLRVRTSSGYEILDRQALDMFRNAKPFVPLPRELRGQEFEVELRAIYSLKDQDSG